MKNKVKNPLKKRVPRELLGDWQKYAVVALFMIFMISFISGMFVANLSMLKATEEGVDKYNREDGHFELSYPLDDETWKNIESGKPAVIGAALSANEETSENAGVSETEGPSENAGVSETEGPSSTESTEVPVTLYENFYRDRDEDVDGDGEKDGTIRVYPAREYSNLACVMKGQLPENENEIAIDRMHADNAGIKVGDTLYVDGVSYEVVGLIAYVNYSTLFEKNTDTMFDALNFNVSMVTEEGFERLSGKIHYTYAWYYEKHQDDVKEEKKLSDALLKVLVSHAAVSQNEILDYVPCYANQAIQFAPDDMGGDAAMAGIILYILVVVIAFVFAITINNTISKEASVIGTLRASGYTRGELIRHYMTAPVIVTLFAAAVGNILGYTLLKNVVVAMYYNSYSLPTYETVWNPNAFYLTTLIPLVLMLTINFIVISKKLKLSPLRFLRHDLGSHRRSKARRLPRWSFMKRFRLRVILQNIPNYLVLFLGVGMVMLMLAMAIGFPDTLDNYQDRAVDMMIAKHQVVLKSAVDQEGNIIQTDTPDAEVFSMRSLNRVTKKHKETVSVYGLEENSRYVAIPSGLGEGEAVISSTYADKFKVKVGDTITLEEKYEDKSYSFTVADIYTSEGTVCVYLPNEEFNRVFGLEKGSFNGYMSDTGIKDIPEEMILTEVTEDDVLKISRQLNHSMGSYMVYFQYLCIVLSAVLIYLLTKIIIEKNENAISMTKILGYTQKEISSLYILSTTIVMLLFDLVGMLVGYLGIKAVWYTYMQSMDGWFTFYISPLGFVKLFSFVFIGYLIVMWLDYRRIRRVPMDEALKNVE